mgnify:CR=1 FL=1
MDIPIIDINVGVSENITYPKIAAATNLEYSTVDITEASPCLYAFIKNHWLAAPHEIVIKNNGILASVIGTQTNKEGIIQSNVSPKAE